jgi:hypothetical protein
MAYPEQENTGLFLPTTNIWDVIPEDATFVTIDMLKELLLRLHQNMNNTSMAVDRKDTGMYTLTEFMNGQSFFPDPTLDSTTLQTPVQRQVYRKVINFGALPNAATKSVAHGLTITNTWSFTRIYATASDPVGLVYFSIPGNGVSITVDATNVNITTTVNMTAYTTVYCVLEFLKF